MSLKYELGGKEQSMEYLIVLYLILLLTAVILKR